MTAPDPNVQNELFGAIEDLEDDLGALLRDLRDIMISWASAAARGELSLDELKSLLEGEKALLEMTALQKKVETKVLLNTLKRDLIETLIGVVKKAL